MSDYIDCEGTSIKIGDTIEHTGHGEHYLVCDPGTEGFLENHSGPILLPKNIAHRDAFKLNEKRALKARVVS